MELKWLLQPYPIPELIRKDFPRGMEQVQSSSSLPCEAEGLLEIILEFKDVSEDFYGFNRKLQHNFPLKLLSINHFLIISSNYQLSSA